MNSSKNTFNSASRDKDNTPAYQVKLDKVLGLTVSSNAAIACDTHTEVVVYPAGCTVVIFNPRKNIQKHILNSSRKTITCLALSNDGRYLVTGECGHLPSVRVWDLHEGGGPGVQVAEFSGHKYGINCVSFSPSQKYVVSVGSQHDMIINLWDWKLNLKTASNKVSTKVKALSFSENGNYFVTVGNRHVKFWYIEGKPSKLKEAMPLMGRSAILGEQRNNYFCDVACGRGEMGDSTYAITKTGLLCEFNNRRLLDKWVELRTTSANCMAIGENFIFIGCADGIVRCFSQSTLQFITTLPRTHYLGVNVAEGTSISHMAGPPSNAKYPDTIALTYDEQNCKLSCVYNDHSLYVWDVRDIKRVGKAYSFLFHSACIWGVDMYPVLDDSPHLNPAMPPGSFVTCSSDDTIRVWNLDVTSSSENKMYRSNIYSKDLLRIVYIDPEMSYLQDLDLCVTGEKNDSSYDGRNGVRSVRISPDGQHMASGDRSGNIRIHNLHTLEEICLIEAHDAEVLSLEYSRPESGHRLLASASRDRLIHVFNADEDYNFNQTLGDHSSSITAVRFLYSGNQMHMVSCGADKSIIFRQLQMTPGGSQIQFSRGHNIAGKTTLYDMEVDSSHKHVLTACQDRNIRVYNINTGKHSKTFKGSVGDEGSLIKVVLDNSGIYAATSCTDKTLCIYDYYSGECMATMFGHSELVTGLRFTNDCRRLISASGDGCIFIWKVPHDMVVTMHARLSQQASRAGKKLYIYDGLENEEFCHPTPDHSDPNYRFSIGQLPFWAKKQIADHASTPANLNNRQMDLPKGRWAQRLDTRHITVKSVYDTDGVITLPLDQDKKVDSDGSKDSSIDSGTELRDMLRDVRRDMYMGKTDVESTEHDGDVEDYSEGEGESTEPEQIQRVMYYPPAEETGSDYTVNAMDVEELRRSQRRNKKNQRPERLQDLPLNSLPTSISGSQESDDDEDASTPSAETTERNLMSMLSASSESLDIMTQREKYLKSTFESMSGPETDGGRVNNKESGGNTISSQYLGRSNHTSNIMFSTPRNVEVIKAAKQMRCATETTRKREELQRRIDETRRKLQSVGHSPHLRSSQSISDLSHIPGKDSRDSRITNLAHRYTAAGGKEYAAIIRNRMNASLPLSTIINVNKFSSINYPTYSASGVEKLLYLSSVHSPPTQNLPKLLSLTSNFQKHINGKMSSQKYTLQTPQNFNNINICPDSLSSTSIDIPETVETGSSNDQIKNMDLVYKHFPLSKSYNAFPSKSVFPSSKYTHSPQQLSAVNRLPLSCSASSYSVGDVLSKNFLGISPSLNLSNCVNTENTSLDLKTNNDFSETENMPPNNNASSSNTETNFGLHLSNLIATKNAWNAANNGGVKPTNKRPIHLNIKSNFSKDVQKRNQSGPPLINQSLPESPVYETDSPTALFGKCLTDTESSAVSSKYGQKRRSCSYFIDLNKLSDKIDESQAKKSKHIVKSSESLPARMSELHASSEENLLDSCNEEEDEDDAAGNFSSDSLEEPSEFSTRTPRRCTSDYQIFKHPKELTEFELGPRSASAAERRHEQKKKAFCSQESILSDNSGCTSSLNSGEILDMGASYEQDRHSSASFFLSLKRNNTLSYRSQESILTDESEYQVLVDSNVLKCDTEKRRDSCRSEGSILESDLNSSLQLENINEFSCATHQDLYHSTESILTDDSDCQIFSSSPRVKADSSSCALNESKLSITVSESDKKYTTNSQINSIDEVMDCSSKTDKTQKCGIQKCNSLKINKKDNHQAIFRTKSLQDTTTGNLPFECSNQNKDGKQNTLSVCLSSSNRLSEHSNNNTNLARKKSFPSSRPHTPNSLQTSPLKKCYSTFFPDSPQNKLHKSPDDVVRSESSKQKPPTAPKPTTDKVVHKPPVKPRQKMIVSQPFKQKLSSSKYITKDLLSITSTEYGSKLKVKNDALQTLPDKHQIELLTDNKLSMRNKVKTVSVNKSTRNLKSSNGNKEVVSGIGVKLLCKSFENAAMEDHDMSDECIADLEEDSYPAIGGSGSSTPATSSSTADSPKRLWPPASRAPVHRPSSKKSTSSREPAPTNKSAPADSDDGGETQSQNLRRSCSLSDLTSPSPQRHTTPPQGKATPTSKTPNKSNTRTVPRHSTKPGSVSQTNIIRSSSMVVLNQQSDSESDMNHSQRPAAPSRIGNLMRHTISSQNKLNMNSSGKSNGVSARRRILSAAYSSVNLSNVGNDDSSSEETSPVGGKPANSLRPRSTSVDRGNSGMHVFLQPQPPPRHGRELTRTAREVTQRLTGGRARPTPALRHSQLDPSPHEKPVKDTDVNSTPLSLQLCTSVADQLTRTADSVVQLHKRLALECDPSTRRDMLSALEEAISETQKTLQCVTTPGEEGASSVDPEMSAKLQELVASSNQGDQTSVLNVVQHCSNILYAMVQKKMSNSVLPQDQ